MKKVFITIITTLLPLMANAAVEINGIWYNLNTNDYTAEVVASQGSQYSGNITIPDWTYYQNTGYKVTSIGNSAFEGCVDITSVSLPISLKRIGNGAFWQCSNLKFVAIPNGVLSIGEGAFNNCYSLVSVVIPGSVTTIGNSAFGNCTNLAQVFSQIQNPFSINSNVFTTYTTTTLVIPKGTKSAYQAKSGWKNFTNIYDGTSQDPTKRTIHVATAGTLSYFIPDDEKYQIEELTLSGELNGTDFRLIRDMAGVSFKFEKYNGAYYPNTNGILKSLDLSNTIIVEGGEGYTIIDECYGYDGLCLPELFNYIYTCNNRIDFFLFYQTKLKSIILPNSVTIIGAEAFKECSALTSITISNRVTSIGSCAFWGCSGLTTIVSEIENPFAIDDNVFYCSDKDIYATATLIVPPGKKSIYQNTAGWKKFQKIVEVGGVGYIFESDGIRYYIDENNTVFVVPRDPIYTGDVVIPGSVEYDGKTYTVTTISFAFYGCSGLTSITIPPSITRIKEDSFSGCTGLNSVHISDLEAWLKVRLDGGSYDDLDYSGSPLYFAHHLYLNGEEVKTIEIPNTWTSIPDFSFDRWSGLTSVTIPNSVTSIGFLAFRGCSGLTSVNIPSSVTSMGWGAFLLCNGLTTIVSEIENPFTIDESVFDNLYATTTLIVPFGKKSAYQNTAGWNKFQNIRELTLGDVNLDAEVNKTDLNALVAYIIDETPKGFDKDLADLNGDDDVNAADVVTLVNLLNKGGLSTEYQPYFDNDNGNLVVTSINCTLNNERNKAIQLTKCELYCNNSMVSYKSYSDGSTVAAGGNKTCSFTGLSIPANSSSFSVVWYYTYNGESYVYRCDLTE